MLSHSPLTKILGPGAALVFLAATATGCGGCNDPTIQCDENGENCLICDGYGCHQAEPGSGAGGAGGAAPSDGQGGSDASEPTCDRTVTTCPCDADDACPGDTQCIEGLCIDACEFSYQCGTGRICINGQCATGCNDSAPCEQPGTRCDNGVCVSDPTNPACSDAKPCEAAGTVCVDGLCSAACQTNAECAEGEVCNAVTGACMADPSPRPGCSGTGCAAVGQQCMADGYCHYPCSGLEACQIIDSRFVACDGGFCKTREEVAPECTLDEPCPEGMDCISNKCL